MGDAVVLCVKDLEPASCCSDSRCRICHEEEDGESSGSKNNTLEAPCACSGTLKFAHRDCIQRWCNEKGDTTCEICLQKYEAGYTSPPSPPKKKSYPADATATVRGRRETRNQRLLAMSGGGLLEMGDAGFSQCPSAATHRTALGCRLAILAFTALLLVRHMFDVLADERQDYPFTIFTLLILRATGILLPMYLLVRTMVAIRDILKASTRDLDDGSSDEDEDGELQRHIV